MPALIKIFSRAGKILDIAFVIESSGNFLNKGNHCPDIRSSVGFPPQAGIPDALIGRVLIIQKLATQRAAIPVVAQQTDGHGRVCLQKAVQIAAPGYKPKTQSRVDEKPRLQVAPCTTLSVVVGAGHLGQTVTEVLQRSGNVNILPIGTFYIDLRESVSQRPVAGQPPNDGRLQPWGRAL